MTRRFDEMVSWYQTVFEAKEQYQNPAIAFLTYDDEHHRFAFANMSAFAPAGAPGVMPAGVGVNHEFLQSNAFAANPIGVEIDPDVLLAQYRSGMPPATLLIQPTGPASPIPPEHGLA